MPISEILSVGTELTDGLIVDTNASAIARRLADAGFALRFRQTCGDDRADLAACLRLALSRSDLVIVTGGLGPTYDDVTRDAVAEVTGRKLIHHEETAERIRAFFRRRGREMKDNNLLQALIPEGAEVLANDWGTAPGVWLETEGKTLVLLPGVPREMIALMEERVLPKLTRLSGGASVTGVLHLFGITESELDQRIPAVYKDGSDPAAAPFAGTGEVELHLVSHRPTLEEAQAAIRKAEKDLIGEFGPYCYGTGSDTLESVLVERFAGRGLTLSAAESCTGGLVSKRVTDVAGSSRVWKAGVTAYSEEMKTKILGVPESVFSGPGVYSEACALAMARGVRRLTGSDYAVGVTGIAGPGGGTDKDPVGTVYIAAVSEKRETVRRFVLGHGRGERAFIRHLAASHAFAMVLKEADVFCRFPEEK